MTAQKKLALHRSYRAVSVEQCWRLRGGCVVLWEVLESADSAEWQSLHTETLVQRDPTGALPLKDIKKTKAHARHLRLFCTGVFVVAAPRGLEGGGPVPAW